MTRMMAMSTAAAAVGGERAQAATPTDERHATTTRPMSSEKPAPKIRRESMSRPTASVPSRKRQEPPSCQAGGVQHLLDGRGTARSGEWGATKSAKTPPGDERRATSEADHRARVLAEVVQNAAQQARRAAGGRRVVAGAERIGASARHGGCAD